jgi:DNA polymerase V
MNITPIHPNAAEYTELTQSLDQMLFKNPQANFVALASGDSMLDVGIYSGDILIIDRALEPKQNDVVVCCYNGAFVCKILDLSNGRLVSANDDFEPVYISQLDNFSLEGIVTSSVRMHRNTSLLG